MNIGAVCYGSCSFELVLLVQCWELNQELEQEGGLEGSRGAAANRQVENSPD